MNCVEFFYTMKWPSGFSCDKCYEYWLIKCVCNYVLECKECHKQHSFYEVDVFNVGSKFKNKPGRVSEQQSVLGILSTNQVNAYPSYIKLRLIKDYIGATLKTNIEIC